MGKLLIIFITFLALLGTPFQSRASGESNVSFTLESDFLSKYVWRGLASSHGFVWQPSANIEAYGFGLSIWANFPVADQPDQGEFNEVDVVPYYTVTVHNLTITPSVEVYTYPGSDPRSFDFDDSTTVRLNLHLAYALCRYFDLYGDGEVDVHEAPGALWFDLGLVFHYPLVQRLQINTSVLFAIGDGRFNKKHIADVGTKFNLFEYSLSFPWNVWRGLTFKPIFQVSTLLAPSLRRAVENPTQVRGGLDIIYDF